MKKPEIIEIGNHPCPVCGNTKLSVAEWSTEHVDDGHPYCTSCQYSALNNYRGLPVKSKFCPHCGKYMTNHDQPED